MEPVEYERYSRLAQEAGQDLGPYLHERIRSADRLDERLESMHRTLARIEAGGSSPAQPGSTGVPNDGVLLEALLLLRQIAGPQKAKIASSEVQRNGLTVWNGDI